jgi:serine/threonine protein kinase
VAKILKQILQALVYLRQEEFHHELINPKEIKLVHAETLEVKLSGIGLNQFFPASHNEKIIEVVSFHAPETFSCLLDFKSDVWSVGV